LERAFHIPIAEIEGLLAVYNEKEEQLGRNRGRILIINYSCGKELNQPLRNPRDSWIQRNGDASIIDN
jgi:hypothetical protein